MLIFDEYGGIKNPVIFAAGRRTKELPLSAECLKCGGFQNSVKKLDER